MIINDCYLEALKSENRFLVLYGSAMSGKSYFCAQKVILRTITEKEHRFLCLRKVGATVKRSIFQELLDVIADNNLSREFTVNKSDFTIKHKNGNLIYCAGLDDPEKIKSIKGITGIWMEEATEFMETDLNQLDIRIRGAKANYIQIILSFNPISEKNWLKARFFDSPEPEALALKTTYKDNSFITDSDRRRLESYKDTNEVFYQVYCLGDWGIIDTTNKFLFNFKKDAHVGDCGFDKREPVKLSFDFNLEPFSVIVYQNTSSGGLKFFDKVKADSDIFDVCDKIKANYPDSFFIVTGDRSGYNRSGTTRGKTSYWQIIKQELELGDPQIKLRARNLDHVQSRILCNSALKFKSITIDESLDELIEECQFAAVDDRGELIKDRKKNKNDFLDAFRYALDAEWPELIRGYKE